MTRRKLCAYLFGAVAAVPAAMLAGDHDDHDHDHRFYDRDHRDWHEWNEGEDRAYHRYWEERRHGYIDWERANEAQRRAYWRWRHEHPDAVLWPH